MNKLQRDTKQLMDDLMIQLARKGFFFAGVIAYREGATDNESVKVGCSVDFYSHPKMRPIVIRMLRNAATILEQGAGKADVEMIEIPEV